MTTSNEAWMDALIRHQVGLMRLAPGISKQVNGLLDESEEDIERIIVKRYAKGMDPRRMENMLRTIQSARSDSWKKVNKKWVQELEGLAQAEPQFLDETLRAVVPTELVVTLPSVGRLVDLVKTTPFEGLVMKDWASRVERSDIERMEQQIKMGLLQGENVDQITKRVVGAAGATKITRDNADSITRTAVNAISNAAKQAFYAENSDILDLEMFLATLDARTTLVCAGNDGKQFPLGKGPIPPLHWRCRSLRLAIINGEVVGERPMKPFTEKTLIKEYAEQHGLGKLTLRTQLPRGHKQQFDEFARKRARELTGRAPAKLSYDEWLRRQSPEFQDEVLGPGRAKLFREGLKLDKFTNVQGDELTLEQLRKLDRGGLKGGGSVPPAPPKPPPPPPPAKTVEQLKKEAQDAKDEAERLRKEKNEEERKRKEAERALAKQREDDFKRMVEAQRARQQASGPSQLLRSRTVMEESSPQLSQQSRDKVLGVLEEAGWARIQNDNLLSNSKVIFKNDLDGNAYGRAYPNSGNIELRMRRSGVSDTSNWSSSSAASGATEQVTVTAVHEFGHVVHLYRGGTAAGYKTQDAVDMVISRRWAASDREFLTKYAETNHKEYFAEAFAKYHWDPDYLKSVAPKAFAMVEEAIRLRNIPVSPLRLRERFKSQAAPTPPTKPSWAQSPPPPAPTVDSLNMAQRYGTKTDALAFRYLKQKANDPFQSLTDQELMDYRRMLSLGFS